MTSTNTRNTERLITVGSGSLMLPVVLLLLFGGIVVFIYSIAAGMQNPSPPVEDIIRIGRGSISNGPPPNHPIWLLFILAIFAFITSLFLLPGFFTLQPNEARVLILFGRYVGTVRRPGFHWGNPFYSNRTRREATSFVQVSDAQAKAGAGARKASSRYRISLRARNHLSDRLKVNDKRGNPIEIAAVIVWHVLDTAQAVFDVDDYENYIRIQSESAIRHLASNYAYDYGEEHEVTLRGGADEVAEALRGELQTRLAKAGVTVDEARLTHLAYAPEIAQAMLRRQQAEAVIAARQKIVQGAVSMVDLALKDLAEKQVVALDDERKAAMVSNLMVVLCGEAEVHPVINTGTLYS